MAKRVKANLEFLLVKAELNGIPEKALLIGRGTRPAERAFYRDFRDFNPLNDLGIG